MTNEQTAPPSPITPSALDLVKKYATEAEPGSEDPQVDELLAPPTNELGFVAVKPTVDVSKLVEKYQSAPKAPEAQPEPTAPTTTETIAAPAPLPNGTGGNSDDQDEVYGDYVADYANFLADKDFIKEIPEGVDKENLTLDGFWSMVEHNVKIKEQENYALGREAAIGDISQALTPTSLDIVNYQLTNPNVTEAEVTKYLEFVLYRNQVADLNPEDPFDAEQVVRQFLEGIGSYTAEEVEDAIETHKLANTLVKQAVVLKPKLVADLKKQEALRTRQSQAVLAEEQKLHDKMLGKVREVVTKGQLKGIQLSQDEKQFLIGVFSTDNVSVPVKGGKQVQMGYVDYMTYVNRYTPEGDMERMMLAMLVLGGKDDAIKRHYAEPVKKEEIRKFFTDKKVTNQFKSSRPPEQPRPQAAKGTGSYLVNSLFNK